ncbi:unnamed protein product [Orchesella dallaii]|uniref:Uncharacterized protein n=1 Tax=Orchesella dallaii TaxID=48710 RepID=A0ABP1QAA8_9HEXA
MEENQFSKPIINEAVESYKKVMSTHETDPYPPDILNTIHSRLIETYTEALRETLNTNEYTRSLEQELEKAFSDFKEMNEFRIEELHRNASQTIHKLKMKYSGDMEDLLDENPDGMEEQVLKKAHEQTVAEVRNLLGKELQTKVRVNEPVEPHWECLKFHTNKYFRSIEDANQENLEKSSKTKSKVVGTEKKVENQAKLVKKPEVKPYGVSVFIDKNAKIQSSAISTTSTDVSKYAAPILLQNDKKKFENPTSLKAREGSTPIEVSQLKPTNQTKTNAIISKLEESYGVNKSLSTPPIQNPIPKSTPKYSTPASIQNDEKFQIERTQKDKPTLPNTQVSFNQDHSSRTNSQTSSQLSKSKSELLKPRPRPQNQYENVSVSYTVAAQSQPIQIKTMTQTQLPPTSPLKKSQSVNTPSRYENLNSGLNQPLSVFSGGGGGGTTAGHSGFSSFSSSTSASASSPSQVQLPPLLISLTPHEVNIGIRLQDQFTTLVNEFGDYFTPMQLAHTKLDTFIYGSKASEESRDSLKSFWSLEECFMWGKNPWSASITINGRLRQLRGEMVVGYILKKLKLAAETQLEGRSCWATLIAVPNWFELVDRCLVEDAARAAGFTSVKLVNQLSAIALRHVGHVKRKGAGNSSNFLILQKYQNFIYAAAYGADTTMERVYLLGHCVKKYKKNRGGGDRRRFLTLSRKTRDNNEREMNRRKGLIQKVLDYALEFGKAIDPTVKNELADPSLYLHPYFVVSDSEEWIEMMQEVVKVEMITKDVNDVMIGLAHLAGRPTSMNGKPIINDEKCLVSTTPHEKNNFSRGQVQEIELLVISEMDTSSTHVL